MTPECLIFDIDGTLWDSRTLVAEGYNSQLEAEGLEALCVTAADLRPLFGMVMTDIADRLFPDIPLPERYALMDRCMKTEGRHLRESPCLGLSYPGVRETIEKLADAYRLYIVSNSQRGYPPLVMEKLGLTPYISGHLCFGDTGMPKGQTIRALMAQHGITSAVYIGDTQGDLDATRDAGIPFVWASYGFGAPEAYDYKIDSIAQLLDIQW